MALIALTSAGGSPGVSTTALGLTLSWTRPCLLVDADPSGSSSAFAGYFRGRHEPTGGLITLALAAREGTLDAALAHETVLLDPQRSAETSAWFLPGSQSHEQAPSLSGLWEPLAVALRAFQARGQDVIVDAGRLGLVGSPAALLDAADLTLLMVGSTLPALAAARSWAHALHAKQVALGTVNRVGLLVLDESDRWSKVAPRVRPYSAREISKALSLPVVSTIGYDPAAAEVYSHGVDKPRKFDTSPFTRSLRTTAASLGSLITDNDAVLTVPSGDLR